MDWIQKIGGRKFWMGLITIGVATFIELRNPNGLSPTMAAFLGSVLAAFSAANYASSAKHMESRQGGNGGNVADKLSQIEAKIDSANNPETVDQLVGILSSIESKVANSENVLAHLGGGVLNIGNQLSVLSKKL